MRTAAYKVDVASDRRRRENVPRHILCCASSEKKSAEKRKSQACLSEFLFSADFGEHRDKNIVDNRNAYVYTLSCK